MDFSRFEVMTFDCYGTLIDWETGILDAIRKAFPDVRCDESEVLAIFAEVEPPLQKAPYRNYRTVLREVLQEFARRFGRAPADPELLAKSLPTWKPFPDTVAALERLRRRFKLGVISNVDDDLFRGTSNLLGVSWDLLVTAEQVGSYKPSQRNFETALARLNMPASRVVHVAQSLFHDVTPARELGIATVWVNRTSEHRGGACRTAAVQPDLTVHTLAELADLAA